MADNYEDYDVPAYCMTREMAEVLVGSFLEQFERMPFHKHVKRMPITPEKKEKLVQVIENTPAWNHPERMQFEVPGGERESGIFYPERLASQVLYPRRVFTNYNRQINKSFFERKVGDFLQWVYDKGRSTFDAEVICREMRDEPQITRMRARSLEAGNLCSSMIHLYETLPEVGKHGGDTPVHVPLFIIPGATKEDLDTLAVYSTCHQHLRPEFITYVRHGVFNNDIDERYFECLEKFGTKAKAVHDELWALKNEDKEENESRIKELENYNIPFLGN